jgi:circadian clock protein KaiC
VNATFRRLVDMLKLGGITAVFTALTGEYGFDEGAETGVSSLMDTWLTLRDLESNGERTRGIYVRKSRGMAHSNQIRELIVTNHGIDLTDVYIGPAGVLTGSARLAQEAQENAAERERQRDSERKRLVLERKRRHLEARVQLLQAKYEEEAAEIQREIEDAQDKEQMRHIDRVAMARKRHADIIGNGDQEADS